MRARLFLRRLTVSAPRMAVRSALPWPIRWVALAVVAGFCAAIAVWSFEFGKEIAGLDQGLKQQWAQAQAENAALKLQLRRVTDERDQALSVANTADTVLAAEKAAQVKLAEANQLLMAENQKLKEDLGFFEALMPASAGNAAPLSLRGVQAEVLSSGELQWQVLVTQSGKKPSELECRLELTFSGTSDGSPWNGALPDGVVFFKLKQYGRLKGVYPLPARTVVRSVTAKIFQGDTLRAVQTVRLQTTVAPVRAKAAV